MSVDTELDRYLTLLSNKMRAQGFTQLAVQDALGWGQSYISQLMTKQKALRVDQLLSILFVIKIDPSAFFAELYANTRRPHAARLDDVGELQATIEALAALLVKRKVITQAKLARVLNKHPSL